MEWETLEKIYDDYCGRYDDIKNACREIEQTIADNITIPIHSIRSRVKAPEHLIEKIIRKRGKEQKEKYSQINAENYLDIIRDFIGIRILVLSKEEWEGIFDWMVTAFSREQGSIGSMEEPLVAYTRYGDRDIFRDKIHKEHTNKVLLPEALLFSAILPESLDKRFRVHSCNKASIPHHCVFVVFVLLVSHSKLILE